MEQYSLVDDFPYPHHVYLSMCCYLTGKKMLIAPEKLLEISLRRRRNLALIIEGHIPCAVQAT